jgi:hypothetical protein
LQISDTPATTLHWGWARPYLRYGIRHYFNAGQLLFTTHVLTGQCGVNRNR